MVSWTVNVFQNLFKPNLLIIINMCGIVGIIDQKHPVSSKLYFSLITLQHRGQDACGISTVDGDEIYFKKNNNLVLNSFSDDDLLGLKGRTGIGHTRYATVGAIDLTNVQPLVDEDTKIGIGFNGNITNYFSLKKELEEKGVFFKTTSDCELILHLFTSEYKKTKDVFASSKKILDVLEGAYSILGIIPNIGLFSIRDKHGIRPLVLGKYNEGYILSSESVVIQTLDFQFIRDSSPGEVIFISQDKMDIQTKVFNADKKAHCMFEWVYFARPESMIEERSVYKARLALGLLLAEKIRKEDLIKKYNIDVVIPVPDTARSCAFKISEVLNLKHREGLIKNRYIGRTFIMPSQESRVSRVHIKLNPIISIVKDKNILLVDDSIVRGTTSKRIIKLLRDAGAKNIVLVSSCPPIKYPCFYGIDMSTEKELIASNKTIQEIRDYVNANEVVYCEVDDLRKAIRRDLCTACVSGTYPVVIPEACKNCFAKDKELR